MAWAALIVHAVRTSAGVIFIVRHARFIIKGNDSVGDDPGLRSVERATGTPASIIFLAFAGFSIKKNAVPGNKTAITPLLAICLIPSSDACNKWSAETAPTFAASSAPPN